MDNMARLTDQCFDFFKKEINKLYNDIESLNSILKKENIKVVVINKLKTPLINADAIRIQKVIHTLIVNSINIASKNTILKITMKENPEEITVLIESHGVYISSEKMKKMFDMYTYNTEKYNKIGSGIGLYLVKKIIEKHNGTLELVSSSNEGSEFVITL